MQNNPMPSPASRCTIELIPLTPPLTGFECFLNAWLYQGKQTFLVDPGPTVTVPQLQAELRKRGITCLDGILLTHIHLDHAGGTGDLLQQYPDTPVYCHPAAVEHLADPERLWQGSLKTLGAMAQAYLPPAPVPFSLLVAVDQTLNSEIEPILTPGHAVHHVSYLAGNHLLAGEAGGVCLNLPSGRYYQRPATPPRFFLHTFINSLDKLLTHNPKWLYYGHHGCQSDARRRLQDHRAQLLEWLHTLQLLGQQSPHPPTAAAFEEEALQALLKSDDRLAGFYELGPEIRERETFFMRNSIKGYVGYIEGER